MTVNAQPAVLQPGVISKTDKLAQLLAEAGDQTEQQRLLDQNPNLVSADLFEAVSRLGGKELTSGNFRQALANYSLAKTIAERTGDKSRQARAIRDVAIAEFQLAGDYALASERFRQSQKIFESLGDRQGVAKILNSFGILSLSQGDYQKALEYLRKSLEQTDEETEKPDYARTLNNIGIVERRLGNYDDSLSAFEHSLKITQALKINRQSAHTLNNMQAVYKERGDYRRALEYLQKALSFEELQNDKDLIARLKGNVGEIYFLQGEYEQALRHFKESLQIGESISDKWLNHQVRLKISRVYRSQGNLAEALEFAERALKISEEIGDKPGIAASLMEIGNIRLEQNNTAAALDFFNRSLQISESIQDKAALAAALVAVAVARNKENQFAEALKSASKAAELTEKIGNTEILWQARTAAGISSAASGNSAQAQKYFIDAISAIEVLREQTAGTETERARFFESKLEPYHQLMELLIEQNNFPEALAVAERAKARVLLDVLENGGRADISKAMTGKERERERFLREALVSLNVQVANENTKLIQDKKKIADLDAKLRSARSDYESFQTILYSSHPELKVLRGKTLPFEFNKAAKKLLRTDTVFLEFIVSEKKVFLAVIANKSAGEAATEPELKIYPLDINREQLTETVRNFRKSLAERNLDYAERARKLYEILLKPAVAKIPAEKTICIVPDGVLWEIPFQALIAGDGKFLIEKHPVFYSSSLSVLLASQKNEKAFQSPKLLALGNPVISGSTNSNDSENIRNNTIGSLPNAEREIRELAVIYGADRSLVLTGKQATEESFKKLAAQYNVLHFATHAALENANPMYSRILLTNSAAPASEDGMLETWEILGMNLRADLAVLSACQTGRGRIGAGEGVIGISWAFFVAGTPNTLVSQWEVDSAGTTELMIAFHRNLSSTSGNAKQSKAAALRAAAQTLLKNKKYRHPFYWAGFVLVGNG